MPRWLRGVLTCSRGLALAQKVLFTLKDLCELANLRLGPDDQDASSSGRTSSGPSRPAKSRATPSPGWRRRAASGGARRRPESNDSLGRARHRRRRALRLPVRLRALVKSHFSPGDTVSLATPSSLHLRVRLDSPDSFNPVVSALRELGIALLGKLASDTLLCF